MKTLSLYIPIHSFVDLITNSSSELFVSANKETLKAIKDIISNILSLGGSDKKLEDIFDVTLIIEEGTYYDNEKGEDVDFEEIDYFSHEGKKIWKELGDSESQPALQVRVTPKDKSDKVAKKTAEILSTINNYFTSEERYS